VADQWTGGSMSNVTDLSAVFAAQAELARQMAALSQHVGSVSAKVEDRVTHKELMTAVDNQRKEQAGQFQHMETKVDGAVKDVKSALNEAVDRIKENLGGITTTEVNKAMAARDQQEQKAVQTIQSREADIDRRIRAANRNGLIGGITGIVGIIIAAIVQALNWGGS
jgi:hypothetical protein